MSEPGSSGIVRQPPSFLSILAVMCIPTIPVGWVYVSHLRPIFKIAVMWLIPFVYAAACAGAMFWMVKSGRVQDSIQAQNLGMMMVLSLVTMAPIISVLGLTVRFSVKKQTKRMLIVVFALATLNALYFTGKITWTFDILDFATR